MIYICRVTFGVRFQTQELWLILTCLNWFGIDPKAQRLWYWYRIKPDFNQTKDKTKCIETCMARLEFNFIKYVTAFPTKYLCRLRKNKGHLTWLTLSVQKNSGWWNTWEPVSQPLLLWEQSQTYAEIYFWMKREDNIRALHHKPLQHYWSACRCLREAQHCYKKRLPIGN